jgi:dTDP-4-amino-4,6-dideoxygalactose transaminase
VQTPRVRDYNVSVYHHYSILCDQRDALAHHLRECGVATGVYYPVPLHLQECFAELGYRKGQFPRCEKVCERVLSLPVHPLLSPEDIDYVAARIVEFCAQSGGS